MWFLSNFQEVEGGVEFDGHVYRTVEHAYQAAKTIDEKKREKIREARSAAEAKRLGREVALRDGWEDIKIGVMWELLKQKFAKEPHKTWLINTGKGGDREIVEWNTWHDTFWGKCVCKEHDGAGENELGHLLWLLRGIVRDTEVYGRLLEAEKGMGWDKIKTGWVTKVD